MNYLKKTFNTEKKTTLIDYFKITVLILNEIKTKLKKNRRLEEMI